MKTPRLGRTACVLLALLAGVTTADETVILSRLNESMPHLTVTRISPSPVVDIYEVEMEEKGAIFYAVSDGSHIIAGDLYALTREGLSSVTEARREGRRRMLFAELDVRDMIVFAPEGKSKAIIHVFTDVDCPHCRKLHEEIVKLNGYGIEVRYLAYPRAGVHSDAFDKMVSAWCSDDRRAALTVLKLGNPLPVATCESPVAAQRALGEIVGVEGTPTLITEDGKRIAGYVPATQLAERLAIMERSD